MFKLRLHEKRAKEFQEVVEELIKPIEKNDSTLFFNFKEFICNFERLTAYVENYFEADYSLKLQRSIYVDVKKMKSTHYYSKMMYYLLEQVDNYEKKCNTFIQKMVDCDLLTVSSKVKQLNTNHGRSSWFYNMYYIYILTIARNSLVDYKNYKESLMTNRKAGEMWYNSQKSYLSVKIITDIFHEIIKGNIYKFIGEEHLTKEESNLYIYKNTSYFVSYIYKNMKNELYSNEEKIKNIPTTKIVYDKMKTYVHERKKIFNNSIFYTNEMLKQNLYKYIPCGGKIQKEESKLKNR